MDQQASRLIIASKSSIRLKLLTAAGLKFSCFTCLFNEEEEKQKILTTHPAPNLLALELAKRKAELVSQKHNKAVVLGFDQVMSCGKELINKPATLEECREQLTLVKGKKCQFYCAVAAYQHGKLTWKHESKPAIQFTDYSTELCEKYLQERGKEACWSPAACQLEGRGVQLIKTVYGSFYSILGVPLLPLLEYLRRSGILLK